jgi:ubiquinone/menaquinone biosynthesis C-methylase UbiE
MEKDVPFSKKRFSVKEAEALSYYDFMSYLDVPYFHIGGLSSTRRLAELCRIDSTKKVLMVGCGTGFSACYLARNIGCEVTGIDIAEISIKKAKERAKRQKVSDRAIFRVGNAYALPFEAETFDAVITEFVSQFLDLKLAFQEFARVLKPGAYVGINEMYREKGIPSQVSQEIDQAEKIFGEITELPFYLLSPGEWKEELEGAGFKDIKVRMCKPSQDFQEIKNITEAMGGTLNFADYFISLILKMAKYLLLSKKIRDRFKKLGEGKKILLRKKSTSMYVGYVLATGRKDL